MSPTAAKKSATRRTPVPSSVATQQHPSAALDELTGGGNHEALGGRHQVLGLERVEVDPATLTLDANTRSELKITPEFKALVAEHGVMVPLLVRRDVLGNLLVVDGQRRLIVALELALPLVPIAMLPVVGDEETRITDQLVTNTGREALTDGEQVRAFQQLAAFGRSATTIARKTGQPKVVVEHALLAAESKAAAKSLDAHPGLLLDHLVAIAEFEADPAVVKDLISAATDPNRDFDHVAQRARDARDAETIKAAAIDALAEGTIVLDKRPDYGSTAIKELGTLADIPNGKAIDPDKHFATCPGHAVHVSVMNTWDGNARRLVARVEVFCTTWKKAGHVNRHAQGSSGSTAGPQTDEQKTDRKVLVANNKAADSALTVRRAWIHEFLQRTVMPKDAEQYVAEVLYAGRFESLDHALAQELLYGEKRLSDRELARDFARPGPALCYLVALAAALAEHGWPRDFWHERASYGAPARVAHLVRLASWGYGLADVEQLAIDALAKKAS